MPKLFEQKAPKIMSDLIRDLGISVEDAAAILGNLGHESGGFALLQEVHPVGGGRGGYGWAQWTGARRRSFEKFCTDRGLDKDSDRANYAYLLYELRNTERTALPLLKAATGLRKKVEAFELGFERAGIKHYDSREAYAKRALDAYFASLPQTRPPAPIPPPPDVEPIPPAPLPQGGWVTMLLRALAALIGRLFARKS